MKNIFSKQDLSYQFFPSLAGNKDSILKLLRTHETPFFITQREVVDDRLMKIKASLSKHWGSNYEIAYSFKTNYDVAKNIKFDLAEVVSKNEFDLALNMGYKYESIIFNGPSKGNLKKLLSKPLKINLDNFQEIRSLVLNKPLKIKAKIGLRLNSYSSPSRFGFNIESGEASDALKYLQRHLVKVSGVHMHLGSDIHNLKLFRQGSQSVTEFIKVNPNLTSSLSFVDFGGGLPAHGLLPQSKLQSLPDVTRYVTSLVEPLQKSLPHFKPKIVVEPGRYLVDDSTVFISKVLATKNMGESQVVTIDSTNNMLPSVWYRKLLIKCFRSNLSSMMSTPIKTTIYGSSCQESDLMYQDLLSPLSSGDLIACYCVGAYNQSQASNFIFPAPLTHFIK